MHDQLHALVLAVVEGQRYLHRPSSYREGETDRQTRRRAASRGERVRGEGGEREEGERGRGGEEGEERETHTHVHTQRQTYGAEETCMTLKPCYNSAKTETVFLGRSPRNSELPRSTTPLYTICRYCYFSSLALASPAVERYIRGPPQGHTRRRNRNLPSCTRLRGLILPPLLMLPVRHRDSKDKKGRKERQRQNEAQRKTELCSYFLKFFSKRKKRRRSTSNPRKISFNGGT